MTLTIFSFTVTIKRRELSVEEAFHQERVEKLYQQNKDHQAEMHYYTSNGL